MAQLTMSLLVSKSSFLLTGGPATLSEILLAPCLVSLIKS